MGASVDRETARKIIEWIFIYWNELMRSFNYLTLIYLRVILIIIIHTIRPQRNIY